MEVLYDPTEEPRHWLSVVELHNTLYRHAFVLPEMSPGEPSTPRRSKRVCVTPATSSSMTSTSATSTPRKQSSAKLAHPSKLHSKDLTAATFVFYVKECIKKACEGRSAQIAHVIEDPFGSPTGAVPFDPDATPKGRSRAASPSRYVPRYGVGIKGKAVSRSTTHMEPPGITLSHLRRSPPLAELARRTVKAEARRRAKERRAQEAAGSAPKKSVKSKHEDESQKAKRLFSFALRTLREEGAIVLGIMPSRTLVDLDVNLSSFWSSQTPTEDYTMTNTTMSSDASVRSSSPPLTPPANNEDAYLPVTPSLLSSPVLDAFKHCFQKKGGKGGISAKDVLSRLRLDERWEKLGLWAVEDTLRLLEAGEKVCNMGRGEWGLM